MAKTTPLDYHRILSPTLIIPQDHNVSIPVGILACQRDPLLRTLTTTVVSSSISQPAALPSKKPAKKAVVAPQIPSDPLLEVVLHDTVIFPEGGGQPTDTGVITTHKDGVTWEVVQAKRHGSHAVHYVRVPNGLDVHAALVAFSPGENATVALDNDGFDRRYDHMSMHTSQHLLSALLETKLNLPTLSWSLTAAPAPCYVEVPRGMSLDEITTVQAEANRLVFEGRRVHVEVDHLDPANERHTTPQQTLPSGRAVGKALPEDYTGGVKRVVVIDGVDRNPCCGTHLPSIHNLQLFLLPHTDALARSSTSSARLYFLSGPRLLAHLASTHALLTDAAAVLSCGAPLVPVRVAQVVEERRRAEKRVSEVESELAQVEAAELVRDMNADQAEGGEGGMWRRHVRRAEDAPNALGFLSAVSSAFIDETAGQGFEYLVVLTSSPLVQTATSTTVVLIFGSDEQFVKVAGERMKTRLGVKGGGKGVKWSGKFMGVWKTEQDLIVGECCRDLAI